MNLSARQYIPTKQQQSISPILNRSFCQGSTPMIKKLTSSITQLKKPNKCITLKQFTRSTHQADPSPLQRTNYYNKKQSAYQVNMNSKMIEIGLDEQLKQSLKNRQISLNTNSTNTASGTNLGSINKSNMNYIRKEEYLSLLEQLNKRNQDEEVYIKAIESLEEQNRNLIQMLNECPQCLERQHFDSKGLDKMKQELQKINRLITMSVKEKNEKEREVEYFHRTFMDQKQQNIYISSVILAISHK